ncbi:ionotropic receptor [Elysia marginata]|uniref:Ionotropic receptor n=1 Tax=Elysia marginata TaxID=1093978 RepID=A0AAV4IDV0_9GAST|nr:ionotropic receptor [Elysia marginata]
MLIAVYVYGEEAVKDIKLIALGNTTGNKYNAIWKAIQRNGLMNSVEEGLARVKAGRFALITESPVIRYYTGLHCDLQAVGEQFSTRPYAIGLKENFPYKSLFSQA